MIGASANLEFGFSHGSTIRTHRCPVNKKDKKKIDGVKSWR
jgi:hypothetical protein